MKKYLPALLLLILVLSALCGAAQAQTHTIAALGLTFEAPEDSLFITGGQALLEQIPEMGLLYDMFGDSTTFQGAGAIFDGATRYLVWSIFSFEQSEWWIDSYRDLSDEMVQEMNQVSGEAAPTILHGKAAKFVLADQSTPDETALVAYTVEGGQGIYIVINIAPDAPAMALHQARNLLTSCAFAEASSAPAPRPASTPAPTPAPTPVPAAGDVAAWDRAFSSIMEDIIGADLHISVSTARWTYPDSPLIGLRTYTTPYARLNVVGDADGTIRQLLIRMPWTSSQAPEAIYDDALDQFGYMAAAAMAAAAQQNTVEDINANIKLIVQPIYMLEHDAVFPVFQAFDWQGYTLHVGYDKELAALFVDLFL
ncbi:MAG: hypothetical protein LBN04_05785 [Oscillospiraceae bacterium]|jgi:hypothetical protein|nr:hypothetical protein [Oscillospiraceae bacterium]